jgi:hypothetical protein
MPYFFCLRGCDCDLRLRLNGRHCPAAMQGHKTRGIRCAASLLLGSISFHAVQYSYSYVRMVHTTVFDFLVRSCHLNLNWKRTVSFNRNMTPRQTQTACIFILTSLQHFYSKICMGLV